MTTKVPQYSSVQPSESSLAEDSTQRPMGGPPRFNFLRPKKILPILVIFGQGLVIILGWTFYGVLSRRPIILSKNNILNLAETYPRSITFVSAQIAHFLSLFVGYLFSRAVLHALAMSLSNPKSLFFISSGISVAGREPILNFLRPKWTIFAGICAVASITLNASFTTLVTPHLMQINTDIFAFSVDFANQDFVQLVSDNIGKPKLQVDTQLNLLQLVEASGQVATAAQFDQPSTLPFGLYSFVTSTGGILPLNIITNISSPVNPEDDFTVTASIDWSSVGVPTNFTTTQQGFTVDVTCETRNLTTTTSPSLEVQKSSATLGNNTITTAQLVVGCATNGSDAWAPPTYGLDPLGTGIDSVLSAGCVNYVSEDLELIFQGSGAFSFINTTICKLVPQVTTVDVDYIPLDTGTTVLVREPREKNEVFASVAYPLDVFTNFMVISQRLAGHPIGNAISFALGGQTDDNTQLMEALESYIRGQFEFSGTLLRATFTETNNSLFPNRQSEIPQAMRSVTHGNLVSEALGWQKGDINIHDVLLPPTFLALVSIGIIIAVLIGERHNQHAEDQDYFDPKDIIHVMAASSVGLPRSFPPFTTDKKEFYKYGDSVKVRLGYSEDGDRIGFVHDPTAKSKSEASS
ncbi:hypothetical protein BDN72DRAFT_470863 [Pluteus cervinus]|uniref:Uncharacterized protein n=1 Tax=Pluteus cervinus TaxID=181527 RepID=A0ACD3AZX5_9AGAR|nr:hypothetical protein BDN72DRAFT_470863 [Pluteus cervinus]